MSQDKQTLCVICAWRENCAKRFAMSQDSTLHCPDFSEDISLKKSAASEEKPATSEKNE